MAKYYYNADGKSKEESGSGYEYHRFCRVF